MRINTLARLFHSRTTAWLVLTLVYCIVANAFPVRRAPSSAVAVDNRIYATGGSNGSGLNAVEIYDPSTNT